MTDTQTIGQRIAHRLIDLDMNQSQLAKKTRRTPGTVSNWVTGQTAPDINVLPSLARVLGVRLDWLLEGTEPRERTSYKKPLERSRLAS